MDLGVGRQGEGVIPRAIQLRTCFFQHLELGLAPSGKLPK